MHLRRVAVASALLTGLVLSSGCGGYTNDNVPEIIVTPDMVDEMNKKEAERMEEYGRLAAEKGLDKPVHIPITEDGAPEGLGIQKKQELLEKRAAKRRKK